MRVTARVHHDTFIWSLHRGALGCRRTVACAQYFYWAQSIFVRGLMDVKCYLRSIWTCVHGNSSFVREVNMGPISTDVMYTAMWLDADITRRMSWREYEYKCRYWSVSHLQSLINSKFIKPIQSSVMSKLKIIRASTIASFAFLSIIGADRHEISKMVNWSHYRATNQYSLRDFTRIILCHRIIPVRNTSNQRFEVFSIHVTSNWYYLTSFQYIFSHWDGVL